MILNALERIAAPLPTLFSTPALVGNTSKVDLDKLATDGVYMCKITAIAIVAIVAISIAFAYAGSTALALLTISITTVPLAIGFPACLVLNIFQTNRESTRRAIAAYTSGQPSYDDCWAIIRNLSAARLLVAQGDKTAINTPTIPDTVGVSRYLLESLFIHTDSISADLQFEIFKELIKAEADLFLRQRWPDNATRYIPSTTIPYIFEGCVKLPDTRILEFLLANKLLERIKTDDNALARLWANAIEKAKELLVKHEFPNPRSVK